VKSVIGILFCLILSVTDIFLYRKGILFARPSLSVLPLLVVLIFLIKGRFKLYRQSTNSLVFFSLFMILNIVFALPSDYKDVEFNIALSVYSLLIYVAASTFFMDLKAEVIVYIYLSAFVLLSGSMLYDLMFNADSVVRGAGFAENPNSAAVRINIMIVVLLNALSSRRNKIAILIFGFAAVFMTLSRGGLLAFIVILLFAVFEDNGHGEFNRKWYGFKRLRSVLVILLVGLLALPVVSILAELIPAFQTEAAKARIGVFDGSSSIVSDVDVEHGGRLYIIENYLELIAKNPLGYGTGMSSHRELFHASTHNMFLRIFVDFGIIGFFLYVVYILRGFLISINVKNRYYMLIFMLILLFSFLDNGLLENRTFLTSLAVMDVLVDKRRLKSF
jgi:hypothetical protein